MTSQYADCQICNSLYYVSMCQDVADLQDQSQNQVVQLLQTWGFVYKISMFKESNIAYKNVGQLTLQLCKQVPSHVHTQCAQVNVWDGFVPGKYHHARHDT